MSPADRAVLAGLVPDEIVTLLQLAYAADEARSAAARNDDVNHEQYVAAKQAEIEAWRDVGEAVANWLCGSSDPVVPIDLDKAKRLARIPADARRANIELADEISKRVPKFRLVRGG